MKRSRVLFACLIAVPFAAAQSPAPLDRLLKYVPEDAALVVAFPSAQKLLAHAIAFNSSVNPGLSPSSRGVLAVEWPDVLKDAVGLDLDAAFVVAMAPDRPNPLILAGVADAAAWKHAVRAEPLEGNLWRVRPCGEPGFAAIQGDVLILCDGREGVQAALQANGKFAERFQKHAGKLPAAHDVVLYADVPPWRPMIEAALLAAGVSVQMGMAARSPPDESMERMWHWFFRELGQFAGEMEVWTAAARFGPEGVFAETTATFRAEGSVSEYLKTVRKTRGGLLRGLPADEALVVAAGEWEIPPGTKCLCTRWTEAALDTETLKQKFGPEACDQAMKATAAAYDSTRGFNFAMASAPGIKGVLVTGLSFTRDPQAVIQNTRTVYAISPAFMNPFGPGSMMEVAIRNERIGTTEIFAFDTILKTKDEQVRRLLEAMYGTSLTTYMAPHAEGVLIVGGPTEAARTQLSRVLTKAPGKLADNQRVNAALKTLAPEPQACLLVDLPRLVDFVLTAVRETGARLPPFKLADRASALIAVGLYLEPDRIRAELAVPVEPVRTLVEGFEAPKKGSGE
jgi:hypothetical protein